MILKKTHLIQLPWLDNNLCAVVSITDCKKKVRLTAGLSIFSCKEQIDFCFITY